MNYHVTAAFGVNPELIGTTINGVYVYSIDDLEEETKHNPVDICMLTVPRDAARGVAQRVYDCAIPAIWNFTNEDLKMDDLDIVVQNVNFLGSLFSLTYYLENSGLLIDSKKAVNQ